MKVILFVTDAGSGHRIPAMAIKAGLECLYPQCDIEICNPYLAVWGKIDWMYQWFKISGENIYNKIIIGANQLWLWPMMLATLRLYLWVMKKKMVQTLSEYLDEKSPDIVVSLMPLVNHTVDCAVNSCTRKPIFIEIMTDMEESYPNFWFQKAEIPYVCGTTRLVQQARDAGITDENIVATNGLIVHSKFHAKRLMNKDSTFQEWNFDPSTKTVLIIFGGYGSSIIKKIFKSLSQEEAPLQFIVLCGHNTRLAQELEEEYPHVRKKIVGFTDQVDDYMRLSDFIITKPGSGTVTEALVLKKPLFIYQPWVCLPQEKTAADWVKREGYGSCFRTSSSFLQEFRLFQKNLPTFENNLLRYKNNGLAETCRYIISQAPSLKQVIQNR